MLRCISLLTGIVLASGILQAQPGSQVFDETVLHRIDVEITLPDWFEVLENDYTQNSLYPDSIPEVYRPCEVRFDGQLVANAGIREKGNSSNLFNGGSKKKPFKIAFDAFVEQRFDGIKKINLNNCTNDPSLVRESIVYDLFRRNGMPAPRTSYAKVYFNGEYWGLYLLVENVDKTFLRMHYGNGNEDGNLYKTQRAAGANFQWKGDSAAAYYEHLKLTTNESENDWSGFIHFLDVLNHSPDDAIPTELPKVFDVENYFKVLAIEKLVKSWDTHWSGGNNFYLYEHPDGIMRWIPWDVNETFQDLKLLSNTKLIDGYLIPSRSFADYPLIAKLFGHPAWKTAYLDTVCALLQHSFVIDTLEAAVSARHTLVDDAYREDPNKLIAYSSFAGSLHSTNPEEIPLLLSTFVLRLNYRGIFPVIASQRAWALDQLSKWDHPCTVRQPFRARLSLYPNPSSGEINFTQGADVFDYAEISIYDLQGARVLHFDWRAWAGGHVSLDVSNLSPGMYILVKTSANGDVGTGKFVRQ